MKTIFNLLAALWFVSGMAAMAQDEPPQVGFIRIVQAVAPGEGNATFLVDGENLFPKGYELGQRTGGIGIEAGSHKIEVRKTGVEPGATTIDLAAGETVTLIGFAERLPAENPDDPPRWATRILRLRQSDPEDGYRLTLVSVCSRPEVRIEAVAQGKETIERATVARLGIARVDLGDRRGEVLVRAGKEVLATISPDSPGNYVVLLYDGADGEIHAMSFYDPKFVIAG